MDDADSKFFETLKEIQEELCAWSFEPPVESGKGAKAHATAGLVYGRISTFLAKHTPAPVPSPEFEEIQPEDIVGIDRKILGG